MLGCVCGAIKPCPTVLMGIAGATYRLLVQMSREMWQFADDGQLFFERACDRFLKALFDKWSAVGVNHTVTVIFFCRTFFEDLTQSGSLLRQTTTRYAREVLLPVDHQHHHHRPHHQHTHTHLSAFCLFAERCQLMHMGERMKISTRLWRRTAVDKTGTPSW